MLGMHAAPLMAGVALSALGGIVRVRAWHRSAADACAPRPVRYRDVVVAQLGGAGFGVLPMRAGDAVKLALLKRKTEGAPVGLLLGSLAAPAALEALVTALVLVWALSNGILDTPSLPGQIPLPLVGVALVVAAL